MNSQRPYSAKNATYRFKSAARSLEISEARCKVDTQQTVNIMHIKDGMVKEVLYTKANHALYRAALDPDYMLQRNVKKEEAEFKQFTEALSLLETATQHPWKVAVTKEGSYAAYCKFPHALTPEKTVLRLVEAFDVEGLAPCLYTLNKTDFVVIMPHFEKLSAQQIQNRIDQLKFDWLRESGG